MPFPGTWKLFSATSVFAVYLSMAWNGVATRVDYGALTVAMAMNDAMKKMNENPLTES